MVSSYGTGLPPYTVAELENTMDGLGIFYGKVWDLVEGLWA